MSRRRTKEGYLNVKQSGRFGKSWKRKWVVAQPNNTRSMAGELAAPSILLELYVEKGAYGKTVNSVLVEGATDVRRIFSKSQALAFEVKKGDDTLLAAAGESEADSQEWVAMFRQQLLLIRKKELTKLPDASEASYRVSVIPNKYSENLQLSGDMLAHVTSMTVGLYDLYEGTLIKEWDLRHTKKFALQSKGPHKDVDKIAIIQISNRSPHGAGDLHLFSFNAKSFLEKIYENLNTAMDVKSKRTRTSSMLFEIPPKELEALGKEIKEGPKSTTNGVDTNGPSQKEGEASVSSETQSQEVEKDIEITSDAKNSSTSDVSKGIEEAANSGKVEEATEEKPTDEKSVTVAPVETKPDTTLTDEPDSAPSTDVQEQKTDEDKTEPEQSEEIQPAQGESSTKEVDPPAEQITDTADEPQPPAKPIEDTEHQPNVVPEVKVDAPEEEEEEIVEEQEPTPVAHLETTDDKKDVDPTSGETNTVEKEEDMTCKEERATVEPVSEETKPVEEEEDVEPVEEPTDGDDHTQEAVADVHSPATPATEETRDETKAETEEVAVIEEQQDREENIQVEETESIPEEPESPKTPDHEPDETNEDTKEEEVQVTNEDQPEVESPPPVEVEEGSPVDVVEEPVPEQPSNEANESKTEDDATQTFFEDEDDSENGVVGDNQSDQPEKNTGVTTATEERDEGTSIE